MAQIKIFGFIWLTVESTDSYTHYDAMNRLYHYLKYKKDLKNKYPYYMYLEPNVNKDGFVVVSSTKK